MLKKIIELWVEELVSVIVLQVAPPISPTACSVRQPTKTEGMATWSKRGHLICSGEQPPHPAVSELMILVAVEQGGPRTLLV